MNKKIYLYKYKYQIYRIRRFNIRLISNQLLQKINNSMKIHISLDSHHNREMMTQKDQFQIVNN